MLHLPLTLCSFLNMYADIVLQGIISNNISIVTITEDVNKRVKCEENSSEVEQLRKILKSQPDVLASTIKAVLMKLRYSEAAGVSC